MTDQPAPDFREFRVLYQRRDLGGPLDAVKPPRPATEHYEFTTVLALSAEDAATSLASSGYHDQDDDFRVIQVVESNGAPTGFEPTAEETPVYEAIAEQHGEAS